MTVFSGVLGALLLILPVAAQPAGEDPELAERKAQAMTLAADPTLSVQANADFLANNLRQPGVQRTRTGLQYKILQNGFGRHPGPADSVEVYYTGKFINGKVFDGTSPGLPAYFQVGKVVPGWTEALQMMREGDHWIIWIPANLGYSPSDAITRGMPPGQTMVFDLRLLMAKAPPRKGDPDYVPDASEREDAQK